MRLFTTLALLIICLFGNPWDVDAQLLVSKNIGATTPLAWGDYDNDGDMDLLQHNGTALRILKNNLVGTTANFADAGITLAIVNPSSVGWIDYNNDGYLDIYYVDSGNLRIWLNTLGTSFSLTTASLGGEIISVLADWGDIDNDGDQDFVGGGLIIKKVGNNRFEVSQRLGTTGRTEFLDFEHDGDLDFYNKDFLYTNKGNGVFELDRTISPHGLDSDYAYRDLLFYGVDGSGNNQFAKHYTLNTGFQGLIEIWDFLLCGGGNSGMTIQYLKIVDFDNDGKNDVLVRENSTINLYTSITANCDLIAELAVPPGRTEVADFDKDGDLDVFIGNNVFENKAITANAPPATPANLTHVRQELSETESLVTLDWAAATDDKTPTASLTYNVIVKRGPYVVFTEGIGLTGTQVLAQRGNAGYETSLKLYNLPKANYTWTVQAVDEAFKTSVLAAEQAFSIEKGPDLITPLSIPAQYSAIYDETGDRYLLTYLKNGDVMGLWADGKTIQPSGVEFKINTTGSASSHIVGYNAVKNEFMVSWLQLNGDTKRIYAKNLLSTGANQHAEQIVYSITDTLKVFLGGDKVAVDPASGKYIIPFFQTRTDLSQPRTKFQGVPVTYYPYGLLDVYAVKVSATGTTIANEIPKLLQTKSVPNSFNHPSTRNFTVQSAVDFDRNHKMVALTWNFMGERRTGYGGGSSGEITSVLHTENLYLVIADENLLAKSENVVGGGGRNHNLLYNPLSDQFMFVWSYWQESTNGSGSDDYSFEVYQRIFSLQSNGAVDFRNPSTLVSKPPNIVDFGSGLPSLSWSKKRNEYLITWTKGSASGSIGVLGEGDQFYRRVHPKGHFIDLDSKFLLSTPGNETIVRNNTQRGHFLLGWKSNAQNQLSIFHIPKDPIPSVKEITPNLAGAGAKVIVRATGMGNAPTINKVFFGGIEAVVDPVFPFPNDSTKIQVTVPTGLTREKVVVKVIFDDQSSTDNVLFENISNTSVTSVAPLVGALGETITIQGTNFPTNPADFLVMFGTVPATVNDIVGTPLATEIKVKVPQAAERGSGQPIGVLIQGVLNTYAGGTFRVIRPPAITSVVAEDDFVSRKIIYINGANFSDNPSDLVVKLGSTVVTGSDFSSANATKITVRIPGGVKGNLPVSVFADDRSAESSKIDFYLGSTIKTQTTTKPNELKFTSATDDKVNFTVEVLNRRAVKEMNFRTKGISESENDWQTKNLTSLFQAGSNRIDFAMPEAEFTDDPVGLDAQYVSIDSSGINPDTVRFKVYRNYTDSDPANLIPDLRFGGSVADYQIVSIPYTLQPNNITTVFKDLFNAYGYDISKWRIFHYNAGNAEYDEYLNGLNEIQPGQGYWLISRYPQDIFFEGARTLDADKGYYEISLKTGWNQIGNPYNFNVSWNDVMTFNGTPTAIESFKTFKDGAFVAVTTIDRFRGGFVHAGADFNLKIPVAQNKGINGGRTVDQKPFASDLSKKEWRLALELKAGDLRNTLGSFGMHPQSEDGEDERDEHRLPNFIQTLDFAFPQSLATSIVGTQESYSWEFEVFNTTETTEVTLRWDNSFFGDNDRELYLHDRTEERLIDMREKNSYTFTYHPGYTFNLHFGDRTYVERKALPEQVVLSDAYPNPMGGKTTIPFTVTQNNTQVQLSIYTLQGQEIRTLVNEALPAGFYEYEWDGKSTTGEELAVGVVMYRLQTSSLRTGAQSVNKKLIIGPR